MPSEAGVNDFLNVLRRRRLPTELAAMTQDQQNYLQGVIHSCIASLYGDRIKPVQSQVQRRLREGGGTSEAVLSAILPLCARLPDLFRIMPPMQGEQPVILLTHDPRWFRGWIDPQSPNDGYAPEVWDAFIAAMRTGTRSLPTPHFRAAEALRSRGVPHLAELALGELEHIVRLALGSRRLLEHHGDSFRLARHVVAPTVVPAAPVVAPKGPARAGFGGAGPDVAPRAPVLQLAEPAPAAASPDEAGDDIIDITGVLCEIMTEFPKGAPFYQIKQHFRSKCHCSLGDASLRCLAITEAFWSTPGPEEKSATPPKKAEAEPAKNFSELGSSW